MASVLLSCTVDKSEDSYMHSCDEDSLDVPVCEDNIRPREAIDDDHIVQILASMDRRQTRRAEFGTTCQIYANDSSESEDYSDISDSEDYNSRRSIDIPSSPAFFLPISSSPDFNNNDESLSTGAFLPSSFSSSSENESFSARSFACEKHSKWKKKCPENCPQREQRKDHCKSLQSRRKLWTKEENRRLLQRVDPGLATRGDADTIWGDIARELHRSVNSTKKKYMRLTNKWSRNSTKASSSVQSSSSSSSPLSSSPSPSPSSSPISPRSSLANILTFNTFPSALEKKIPSNNKITAERRATVVCEKHRRWKKRCPADCKDKQEAVLKVAKQNEGTTKKRKIRHYRPTGFGIVGRPAVSCKQHQLEHQKCPEDCPRRFSSDPPLPVSHNLHRSSPLSFPHSFLSDNDSPTYISPPISPPQNLYTEASDRTVPNYNSYSSPYKFNSPNNNSIIPPMVIPSYITTIESRESPSLSVCLQDQCAPITIKSLSGVYSSSNQSYFQQREDTVTDNNDSSYLYDTQNHTRMTRPYYSSSLSSQFSLSLAPHNSILPPFPPQPLIPSQFSFGSQTTTPHWKMF